MPEMSTASIQLHISTQEKLEKLALQKHLSTENLMREVIETYVERAELRASFIREGLDTWTMFEKDGLHLTEQEADQWLANLEAGDAADETSCHN